MVQKDGLLWMAGLYLNGKDAKTPLAAAEIQQWLANAAKSALELATAAARRRTVSRLP